MGNPRVPWVAPATRASSMICLAICNHGLAVTPWLALCERSPRCPARHSHLQKPSQGSEGCRRLAIYERAAVGNGTDEAVPSAVESKAAARCDASRRLALPSRDDLNGIHRRGRDHRKKVR